MAEMIPDFVHSDCKSDAEKQLFTRFRDELGPEYTVFHSLGIAEHSSKLYSDIDFLVMSESGLLAIEVKGGGVEYSNGIWHFTNRYGKTEHKKESPMQQAAGGMYALRHAIGKKFGEHSDAFNTCNGYAAFFKDAAFKRESPEWNLKRIYDRDRITQPIAEIVADLYELSRSEIIRITHGNEPCFLSAPVRKELTSFLRADFHYIPPIGTRIQQDYDDIIRLSESQFRVLDSIKKNKRLLVTGGAGSGKTVLAMEMARQKAREGKRVGYFCHNSLLAFYVEKKLKSEGFGDNITASTMLAWCRGVIKDAGMLNRLTADNPSDSFSDDYPKVFPEAFIVKFDREPFEYIIVDEGQDFHAQPWFESVLNDILAGKLKSGSWAWFEDDQQAIFRQKDGARIDMEKYEPAYRQLNENWRNTEAVGVFNSMATGTKPLTFMKTGGIAVEQIAYRDQSDQKRLLDRLVARLLGGNTPAEDIVILSASSIEKCVAREMSAVGGRKLHELKVSAGMNGAIPYTSIYRFKGLESKAVIVTDIKHFEGTNTSLVNYTGFSRANAYLAVLYEENAKEEINKRALEYASII